MKVAEIEELVYPLEGASEPTARVLFATESDAAKAVKKLDGHTIKGCTVHAKQAKVVCYRQAAPCEVK